MNWAWPLVAVCGLSAAELPKVFYSKSFPGSAPAYAAITLDKSGRAEYKEDAGEDAPLSFQLTEKETAEIFALAEKLGRFTRPLEANLKVANTGIKTFRYESGAEKNEVKFNYSLDADARLLWEWFERIAETEQHYLRLQRTAKYDKLGVNQALLLLEASRDRGRLVAPQQFVGILERIAKNESYLHMARTRAAGLADSFRKTAE